MNTTTLDCTGLNCPLPILRLSKAIKSVAVGEQVEMVATDPGSVKDVKAWAEQTGNALVESQENAGRFTFLISKRAA
jgi:tRNA 2-thiouridine synthesizing protein A